MANSDWLGLDASAVLIAGAGGLGTAIATGFVQAGAEVMIVDRDQDRLAAVIAEIKEIVPGSTPTSLAIDLTQTGSGAEVIAEAVTRLGALDAFVHAIGINDRRPIVEFTGEEWDHILRVNLTTAFELAQSAGRHMVSQQHGRIVMLSSVSGLLAHKDHGPYAASKGAINQLMRVMAHEWAPHGVTVNAIAPGYIETNLTAAHLAKDGVRDGLVQLVPAGRLGRPEEVVGPILFLCSRHAGFVTGQVVYVDGGRTLV